MDSEQPLTDHFYIADSPLSCYYILKAMHFLKFLHIFKAAPMEKVSVLS